MIGSDTEKIINKLFQKLLSGYQTGLEKAMNGSNFVFETILTDYFIRVIM